MDFACMLCWATLGYAGLRWLIRLVRFRACTVAIG